MRFSKGYVFLIAALLTLSGCVTSHFKNDKGCECTRRYFTLFAVSARSCSDVCQAVAEPEKVDGEVLEVAPLAPSPSLRESTPAKAIAQNIKSTTQAFGR